MALKYFGTDGVRGPALVSPLSLEDTKRWGRAWAQVARQRGAQVMVLGWDPRLSSEPLAQAFIQGINGDLELCVLGMVPTPAVSWATQQRPGAWGLMISASHNPPADNGIKGFDGVGEKISELDEEAIEAAYEAASPIQGPLPALELNQAPMEGYLSHLEGLDLPADFKAVIDCAHGATAAWAPKLLRGASIEWHGIPADGARINVGVGSTHMETLQARVKELGADVGIAFDGDGDRCLLVDPEGHVVDGDQIIWLMAQDLQQQGHPVPGVVGTVMSNGGLEEALEGLSIPFSRTQVGDKFMLRELATRSWDLAAEASGHVIQKHLGPSGDGLSAAIACLKALLHRAPSQRWAWRFQPWPLKLLSLVAPERKDLEACNRLQEAQAKLEREHGHDLRMVIRWSGTEPKLRLMVEAKETRLVKDSLHLLEAAARSDLGL
jgi:phosphoglucosamine mutase